MVTIFQYVISFIVKLSLLRGFPSKKLLKDYFERLGYFSDKKDHVMVDVGAQFGTWSTTFAGDNWRVIAFEALPENYNELVKNTKDFENISCINKAVSNKNAKDVPFYFNSEYIGIHSLKTNHPKLSESSHVLIDTVTLDTALSNVVDKVDFLKIDIEGADLLALKGLNLEKFRPDAIICEYGGRSKVFGYSCHDMASYVEKFGYTVFITDYEAGVDNVKKGETAPDLKLRYFGLYRPTYRPVWGDMIFIADEKTDVFISAVLSHYLYRAKDRLSKLINKLLKLRRVR